VVFGEVGLAGEIRPAPRGQERLKEAAKLGFTHAIVPKANAPRAAIKGIEVIALDRVEQAIEQMRMNRTADRGHAEKVNSFSLCLG
jgi:DNA repair protein RadA/Sms